VQDGLSFHEILMLGAKRVSVNRAGQASCWT